MSALLEIAGVGKSYRSYSSFWWRVAGWMSRKPSHFSDHWVLRDVTFAVERGEAIGIVGRNGAGKSTLLKIIAGTVTATEGGVVRRGRVSAILDLAMGFNGEFTGRQNAIHACGLLGFSSAEVARLVPAIEEFADVGAYFDQPLRTYSSGMAVRVGFAVATAARPDVLIVDEALAVGDLSFQAKCFERINRFRAEGTTLLYVSHGPDEIARHCTRALFIKNGGLVFDGSVRDATNLYLDDLFGAGRTASPAERTRPAHAAVFATDAADHFGSRPGYRKEEHRWGVGGAAIVDYFVTAAGVGYPPSVASGQELEVSFKVVFASDVARPVYGLLIKTLDGMFVYGTNSLIARTAPPPAPAVTGDVKVATFTLPLNLNGGAYLISVGVSDASTDGEMVPLDRRYDAILLAVGHSPRATGLIDLNAECNVQALA